MNFRLLCILSFGLCVSAWSEDTSSQQNPPGQGDGNTQSPSQTETAPPQPTPPPQGGDFSNNWDAPKVPSGVILVKGAWASASDSVTPLPEGGSITDKLYKNQYFSMSYPFPADWYQKFEGPPPSDNGFYVLFQLRPADTFKGPVKGSVLASAQDLFFSLTPGKNALEMVNYNARNLRPEYALERAPAEVKIAGHSFVRMDYVAPAAGLHWYVLTTEIRCHAVQFVAISRDTGLLDRLIQTLEKWTLPDETGATTGTGGGNVPVCIKGYASAANTVTKVDPVLPPEKFNPIPVRIIIGKNGKVQHVHMISAFPDQAKIITDALLQWEFKPYIVNGEPVPVETGIMFGLNPRPQRKSAAKQGTSVAD